MKAWRFYGIGDMRLDDIPVPSPKPGWVLLKARTMQPSVTEAIRAKGGATAASDLIRKRIAEEAPVQLFGHEYCAEVVEVGEGVTNVKVGDRVAGRTNIPCGECSWCLSGMKYRCRSGWTVGRQISAAMAEFFVLPADVLSVLPDTVSDSEGACIQPLSGCVTSIAVADIRLGDTVAVMGQGVMGLSVMQLARINGAGTVIGVDIRKENLRLSKELGSDYQVDASEVDPVAAIREITHGFGADVVFEAAGGSPEEGLAGNKTLNQAMDIVADAGKIVQIAHFDGPFQFNANKMRSRAINYLFPEGPTPRQLDYTVQVVADGRVRVKPMITQILEGIEQIPKAFEITGNKAKYGVVNPAQVVISR